MKKVFSLALALAMMGSSSVVFAETNKADNTLPKAVYDTEKVPSKDFTPYMIDGAKSDLKAAPYWSAKSTWYFGDKAGKVTSDSYTDSSKNSKKAIDRIMAKSKVYFQGALDGSNTDDGRNSSHAGTVAYCSSKVHIVGNHEVYGNHAFEESGYVSWYPETFDT